MCIGDNVEDCPPGVLTPEELNEIKTLPRTEAEKTFLMLAVNRLNTYKEIHAGDRYDLHRMVLRNLTKKFYVRRDVVVVKELVSYCGDLCNVLLANICYTTDLSCVMRLDISSGAWAGDRFDVVRLCDFKNDEEWEDVGSVGCGLHPDSHVHVSATLP